MSDPAENKQQLQREVEEGFPSLDAPMRAFALEYLENGFQAHAAGKAVGVNGNRAIRDPLVQAYIEALQERGFITRIVTADFIAAQYLNLYDMALGNKEVPIVTGQGEQISAKKFHPELAVKCVDKLSTLAPEFDPRSQLQVGDGDLTLTIVKSGRTIEHTSEDDA